MVPMKAVSIALSLATFAIAASAQEVEHFKKRDASVALIRVNGGAAFQMQSQAGQNTCTQTQCRSASSNDTGKPEALSLY